MFLCSFLAARVFYWAVLNLFSSLYLAGVGWNKIKIKDSRLLVFQNISSLFKMCENVVNIYTYPFKTNNIKLRVFFLEIKHESYFSQKIVKSI